MTARMPVAVAVVALLAAGAAAWLPSGRVAADTPDMPAAVAAPLTTQEARDRGRDALALVTVPADLGYRVLFRGATPDGPRAVTDVRARKITVFVGRFDSTHRIAHDLAHEYGHAWDHRRLAPADRAAYLRARGMPTAPWWPTEAGDDYATGAGDFAEVFAACRAASPDFRSRLATRPPDPCAILPGDAGRSR